ncbi:MAG: D-tyrosyl-tRNA(Tyr) deacylase [Clostridia bacterium]|nr:D-tyrosyl-tRNA(Tyr) deacylase [Clostridia bacterium]
MRCVIQRVANASVAIDGQIVGRCGRGFMILIGVSVEDTEKDMQYMADKIPNLRIFEDENGKMNKSIRDVGGEILAVSQFTLYGDARGQRRPSFITAARPEQAIPLYEGLVEAWRRQGVHVETGEFGADMQVSLVNDGPVTLLMDSTKLF